MNKIAHFGTFDVNNYGDLLFPHIAEYRLPIYKWEHISPTNNKTIFEDSKPIISFKYGSKKKYKALVVGGGNILHLMENKNTVYKNSFGFAYADLWIGVAKMAMTQKIPYVFNAPGVSRSISSSLLKKLALLTFENSNYVAFREKLSLEIIEKIRLNDSKKYFKKYSIVPDTAFDISKMWPLPTKSNKEEYICVNLNERYHQPINETAKYLDKISFELKMPVKLIIIGDCHGDFDFTNQVSRKMKSDYEIIKSDGLKKLAHVIGYSNYFLGSSMHGFITALSYNVPSFLVLKSKPLHKFVGLLDITKLNERVICQSFKEVLNSLNTPAILSISVKEKIHSDLDIHWGKIDNIINEGKTNRFSFKVFYYKLLLKMQLKYQKLK